MTENKDNFLKEYEVLCKKYKLYVSFDYNLDSRLNKLWENSIDSELSKHLEQIKENNILYE